MKNGNNKDLDGLVDIIVNEVKRKLGGGSLPGDLNSRKKSSSFKSSLPIFNNDASGKNSNMNSILAAGAVRIGTRPGEAPEDEDLARHIDHTLLKPDATQPEIRKLCEEAIKYSFKTVCVNSSNIKHASKLLEGKSPLPIAVIGFPLGAAITASKAFETTEAIKAGAKEIDMVINIGSLKAKNYLAVLNDIKSVVDAAGSYPVKVILETANLTREEKIIGSALSKAAGAAFVKTSTGFGKGGATVEDVALMRRIVGDDMGVKASGGIHSREDAKKMISAGANRIGASASIAIVSGTSRSPDYKWREGG